MKYLPIDLKSMPRSTRIRAISYEHALPVVFKPNSIMAKESRVEHGREYAQLPEERFDSWMQRFARRSFGAKARLNYANVQAGLPSAYRSRAPGWSCTYDDQIMVAVHRRYSAATADHDA